jgi:hypothetical protein
MLVLKQVKTIECAINALKPSLIVIKPETYVQTLTKIESDI